MSVKLASINIFSFNDKNKVEFIKDFLDNHCIDICFIQETHVKDTQNMQIIKDKIYSFDVYSTLTKSYSAGVAILVRKDKGFKVINEYFEFDNRLHGVEICINKINFNFINIYTPNSSENQCEFVNDLHAIIGSKKNIILGGDFNYIEDRDHDKKNTKKWNNLYKNFNLCEFEWNIPSINMKDAYTWSKGNFKSRIDRFYCENPFKNMCKYIDICETSMSDHKMIICEMTISDKAMKKNKNILWKLNEKILENEKVDDGIKDICKSIPDMIKRNKYKWYDIFIQKICNFLKHESRIINMKQKKEINNLFQELKEIDSLNDEQEISRRKRTIREKIEKYYEHLREGNEKRMRNDRMKFVKQPSKTLLQEERRSNASCSIEMYKTADGITTTKLEVIKEDIFNYYNNLLGDDIIDDDVINNYQFNIKPMNVEENIRENINSPITYDELWRIIKDMKESAPGSSGLTIGFYKKYFKHFGQYFVELINSGDELPTLFKESIVKLIPKNSNSIKTINDLRPISLTNIDYRIYTKALANRMKLVADKVIKDHQTCSIRGRRINDNINLIRDVIFECENNGSELFILSVDQSKAFDRISHKYLFKLLKHMNFGPFITNAIMRIYDKSCAKVVVNNSLCKTVTLKSSLKQGCALSMLLYIICIEELIVRIENNNQIKGAILNTTKKYECKASGYADDIAGMLRDRTSMTEFFKEFQEWGKVSAAVLNVEKTKILAINSQDTEFEGIKFIKEMKILGIEFNEKGITDKNINIVIDKIKKALFIWDGVFLNTLERIIISKTFILSKLWYVSNFVCISEQNIAKIEKTIYEFIWCNSFELIKRNTLILPYDSGGLNSVCIRTKINTCLIQNFINIYLNHERIFYQLSVKYMKYDLRHLMIFKSFNIIPTSDRRPDIYDKIHQCVVELKTIDKDFLKNIKKYTSKQTYNKLIDKICIRPKVECMYECDDWKTVYNRIHNISENSDLRSFIYKLLFNALHAENRFNNKKNKCFFCETNKETCDHLFFNCKKVICLFQTTRSEMENKNISLSKQAFWFDKTLSNDDFKTMAILLYSIWRMRESIRKSKAKINIINLFINTYKIFKSFM